MLYLFYSILFIFYLIGVFHNASFFYREYINAKKNHNRYSAPKYSIITSVILSLLSWFFVIFVGVVLLWQDLLD